jgi:hypothetical protein
MKTVGESRPQAWTHGWPKVQEGIGWSPLHVQCSQRPVKHGAPGLQQHLTRRRPTVAQTLQHRLVTQGQKVSFSNPPANASQIARRVRSRNTYADASLLDHLPDRQCVLHDACRPGWRRRACFQQKGLSRYSGMVARMLIYAPLFTSIESRHRRLYAAAEAKCLRCLHSHATHESVTGSAIFF